MTSARLSVQRDEKPDGAAGREGDKGAPELFPFLMSQIRC